MQMEESERDIRIFSALPQKRTNAIKNTQNKHLQCHLQLTEMKMSVPAGIGYPFLSPLYPPAQLPLHTWLKGIITALSLRLKRRERRPFD